MNIQPKRNSLTPETVTTGPLPGSRKVYHSPAGRPELRVPPGPATASQSLSGTPQPETHRDSAARSCSAWSAF